MFMFLRLDLSFKVRVYDEDVIGPSLAPWRFEWNFGQVISKRILLIDGWGIS